MSTITLPNIRVGSDLQVRVRLKDGGVAIDWSTLSNIKACIYSDAQRALAGRCAFSIDEEDNTLLVCTYAANKPQYLGVNRIVISAKYMGETKTYDKPAFSFVRWTADQEGEEITIDDPDVDVEITVEDVSSSILQEAVDAAFSAADRANEAAAAAEHMVDIHTGPEGKSAYEVAVEEGYTGTEEEWLASLVGPQGAQGIQGETGEAAGFGTVSAELQEDGGDPSVVVAASGADTAKQFAFTFKNLKGDKGDKGDQGNTGSSVDYPYELVNNCTTDDATKGLAASQGVALQAEVSQLEAEVDGLAIKVNYKVGADIGVNANSDSWKLTGTGLCASDSTARIRKYLVTAGTYIYLKLTADTAGVYQFQSAASVPSSGTNANLVGTPVTAATEGLILVPTGATYLIVSELKTNTTNQVKSTTPLVLSDIGSSELLVAGATASGTILPSGIWQSNASYRVKKIAVSEGQLLYLKLSKDTDVVYQWQNNATLPSVAPNPYLVGLPITEAADGFVFVPSGATYLMVVESTSNTTNTVTVTDKNSDIVALLGQTISDTKVVNEDDFTVKNTSVNFSKRGVYITRLLNLDTSSYWYMSDPFLVRKGQKVSITATDTGTASYLLIGVNSSTPITSVSDVRTFKVITELSPGNSTQYVTREWIATEDTYVIAQRLNLTSLYLGNPAIVPELAEIWGLIHNFPEGDELPDYVKNERNRVYGILVNRSIGDVHISAFNTDQHFDLDHADIPTSTYNPKWVMQGIRAMKEICDQNPVDMVVLGGDVAGYGGGTSADEEGIIETVNYLFVPLVGIDSVLVGIPGNHDAYQNNGDVTAQSMYNAFAKRNQRHLYYHGEGTDNCDAYVDDTRHKIRSIFVDTYSRNTRTEDFRTFLADALDTLPAGYMAVVYSHNALTNEFAGSVLAQKISDPSVTIDAFQNPTDCHAILDQYADKIIACICGHSHFDASAVSSAGILYIETTTAAPHTRNYTTDSIPNTSTIGTVTDTSFDFFVIDQNAQTIEAVRYGEGCNRKWKYKGEDAGMMDGYPQAIVRS